MYKFARSLSYFIRIIYDTKVFDDIKKEPLPMHAFLIAYILNISALMFKLIITYPWYREVMLSEIERLTEGMRQQGRTFEEIENVRKSMLQQIALPVLVVMYLGIYIFVLPTSWAFQTFAFAFAFFLFGKFLELDMRRLFSLVIYSKSPIILGTFATALLAYVLRVLEVSLNLSFIYPHGLVGDTLRHVELFSVWSLFIVGLGLRRIFGFSTNQALRSVLGVWILYLVLNAFFVWFKSSVSTL